MIKTMCIGCGGALQNNDSKAPYYTPKPLDEATLCQRCFRLRHYNEDSGQILPKDAYRTLMSGLAELDILVVMVVDVFDLEGSMLPQIPKLTGNNDVLVLINKRDLLPKSASDQKLLHRIKKRLADSGIKALDAILVSALKKQRLDQALEIIFEYSKGRDIYIVGATNVGKSTLINAFIKASSDYRGEVITVSHRRGTTQGFIPIAFENQTLYDTPGLYNSNHIAEFLDPEVLEKVTPKKEIKARVFQLRESQTLFITGFLRIDIMTKAQTSVSVLASDFVGVHRRKTEGAAEFHEKHLGGLLSPPMEAINIKWHKKQFVVRSLKRDIVVPGLAIITIKGAADITLFLPEGLTAYEREALL